MNNNIINKNFPHWSLTDLLIIFEDRFGLADAGNFNEIRKKVVMGHPDVSLAKAVTGNGDGLEKRPQKKVVGLSSPGQTMLVGFSRPGPKLLKEFHLLFNAVLKNGRRWQRKSIIPMFFYKVIFSLAEDGHPAVYKAELMLYGFKEYFKKLLDRCKGAPWNL